ncbi:unnamed protein product [Phytophthora lilii]|uniref:Unnamed protein product n=1 Tax=Phytophthora lilii TaxID=2077276 RepID=A0A9W6XD86_9STRA|nr:unnamed protein product [Phytophthora lilii]
MAKGSRSAVDSADGSDAKDEMEDYEDLEEKAPALAVVTPDTPEDAILSAGRSGGSRSLSRNLADELEEVAGPEPAYDDYDSDAEDPKSPVTMAQPTKQAFGYRPPLNGDTPAANKVLARCYEEMKASEWIQPFEPTTIRQAVWADLSNELAWPVASTSMDQSWAPAEAGAELWKWKKRLRGAFGATAFNMGRRPATHSTGEISDPSNVPLPKTPTKSTDDLRGRKDPTAVFSATGERSPYFQDSHMVTPKSANRTERVRAAADNSADTRRMNKGSGRSSRRRFQLSDDSFDDDDDSYKFTGDGGAQMKEYLRQIREVTEMESQNVTPRIAVATHRPLGQIKAFSGLRNKSENSMQWLRAFVYEMIGTRATPNEWCMPFELSLRDGALHWYRQLPKKTKRQWSLLSEAFIKYYCSQLTSPRSLVIILPSAMTKEHICDYLNRLNGYARNAGIQFENGGLKARDHGKRFLETCGDRGLERHLCHIRVKDTHELEEMITEILRNDEHRRREDSRDHYNRRDRRERQYDRRRDDSRNVPRVTLAEASVADIFAELQERPGSLQRNIANSGSEADSDELSNDSLQLSDTAVMDTPPTGAADISRQLTKVKDELLPKVHSHVPTTEAQGVTQRAEISAEMTAIHHEVTAMDVRDNTDLAQPVVDSLTPPTIAVSGANCANKCTTPANAKFFSKLQTSFAISGQEGPVPQVAEPPLHRTFKLGSPPTETRLVLIGLPQLAEPAVEAECIYAFFGKCEWPEEDGKEIMKTTELLQERSELRWR